MEKNKRKHYVSQKDLPNTIGMNQYHVITTEEFEEILETCWTVKYSCVNVTFKYKPTATTKKELIMQDTISKFIEYMKEKCSIVLLQHSGLYMCKFSCIGTSAARIVYFINYFKKCINENIEVIM